MFRWEPHRRPAFSMVTDNRKHVTRVPLLFLPFGTQVIPMCPQDWGQSANPKDPEEPIKSGQPPLGPEQKRTGCGDRDFPQKAGGGGQGEPGAQLYSSANWGGPAMSWHM